jgi:hypothetical protein
MPDRTVALMSALAMGTALAPPATGAPSLQIRGAAARVAIVPEARADVRVTVLHVNPRLPLHIHASGGKVLVVGDVGRRVRNCIRAPRGDGVEVWGRGRIARADLPFLVVRTPLDVRVSVGDAVYGVIGRSAAVDFTNQGCGDWTIANVAGRLRVDQAGAGDSRAGAASGADLSVAGSGRISMGPVGKGLTAVSSGSGDIAVARVSGPVDVRVAGTGDVDLSGGHAAHMEVSIAGSGSVRMAGEAESLTASITGSGDVVVAAVAGPVVRRVFGSGAVKIGR